MVQMDLLAKRNRDTDAENKYPDSERGRRAGRAGRLGLRYTHCSVQNTSLREPAVQHRETYSVLSGNPDGKEIQGGGPCSHAADSLGCKQRITQQCKAIAVAGSGTKSYPTPFDPMD